MNDKQQFYDIFYDRPTKEELEKLAAFEGGLYKRFWQPTIFPGDDRHRMPNTVLFKPVGGFAADRRNVDALHKSAEMLQLHYIPESFEELAAQYPASEDEYNMIMAAVGAYESWGFNDMGDAFFEQELIDAVDTYPQFGSVYYRHRHVPKFKFGKVLAAVYDPMMRRIVIFARVNLGLAPREALEALLSQESSAAMTSMGAKVAYDVCSICGNIARVPKEHCEHVTRFRHEVLVDGKYDRQAGMFNFKPVFYDISFVPKNAWPASFVIHVFERDAMLDRASVLVETAPLGDPPKVGGNLAVTRRPTPTATPELPTPSLISALSDLLGAVPKAAEAEIDKPEVADATARDIHPHLLALFLHDAKPLRLSCLDTLLKGTDRDDPISRLGIGMGRAARLGLLLTPTDLLALLFRAARHPGAQTILERRLGIPGYVYENGVHPELANLFGIDYPSDMVDTLLRHLSGMMDEAVHDDTMPIMAPEVMRRVQLRPLLTLRMLRIMARPDPIGILQRNASEWEAHMVTPWREYVDILTTGLDKHGLNKQAAIQQLLPLSLPLVLLYADKLMRTSPQTRYLGLGLAGLGAVLAAVLMGNLAKGSDAAKILAQRYRNIDPRAVPRDMPLPEGDLDPVARSAMQRITNDALRGTRPSLVLTNQAGQAIPPTALQYGPNTVAAIMGAVRAPVSYTMKPEVLAQLDALRRAQSMQALAEMEEVFTKEAALEKEAGVFGSIKNVFKKVFRTGKAIKDSKTMGEAVKKVAREYIDVLSPTGFVGKQIVDEATNSIKAMGDKFTNAAIHKINKAFGVPTTKPLPTWKRAAIWGSAGLGASFLANTMIQSAARRGTLDPTSKTTRVGFSMAQNPMGTAALFASVPIAFNMLKHVRAELYEN